MTDIKVQVRPRALDLDLPGRRACPSTVLSPIVFLSPNVEANSHLQSAEGAGQGYHDRGAFSKPALPSPSSGLPLERGKAARGLWEPEERKHRPAGCLLLRPRTPTAGPASAAFLKEVQVTPRTNKGLLSAQTYSWAEGEGRPPQRRCRVTGPRNQIALPRFLQIYIKQQRGTVQ